MKALKAKIFIMLFVFSIAASFSGCAVRRVQDPASGSDISPNRSYSRELGTPATEADRIAKAVQAVPGVKGAAAVINGNTAYVGINLETNTDTDNTSKIQNIKKQAADTARNTDTNIKTVYISADADFFQRITQISNDVRNGKPIEGFKDELNKIVKRITPEKQ